MSKGELYIQEGQNQPFTPAGIVDEHAYVLAEVGNYGVIATHDNPFIEGDRITVRAGLDPINWSAIGSVRRGESKVLTLTGSPFKVLVLHP